jgi:hypothetical protein
MRAREESTGSASIAQQLLKRVMNNLKRDRDLKLIELLKQLSPHGLYKPCDCARWLTECGFDCSLQEPDSIVFLDESVSAVSGEWGRGLSPFSLLTTAIHFYGFADSIESEMTGRGFMYSDLLRQLESCLLAREG